MSKCSKHSKANFYEGKCLQCRNGVDPDWVNMIEEAKQDEHGWINIKDNVPSDFNIEDCTKLLFYSDRYRDGSIGYFVPEREGSKWTDLEGTRKKNVSHWQLFNTPVK